jgi:predicted deacetylase
MAARLVVSLSGTTDQTLDCCAELTTELDRRGVPLSLLFAPRVSGALDWIHTRRAAGDALLLHGFDHAAGSRSRPVALGRRAEFAALPAHEAGLRLAAAILALGRLGLVTDAFAPPRWLISLGGLTALRRTGFALCADLTGVRDLGTGTVHKGRVQGIGPGELAEPWWCYALVLGAGRQARRGGLVRIAVDAAVLDRSGPRQAVLDAVDLALHHGARPATYPDLIRAPQARAA